MRSSLQKYGFAALFAGVSSCGAPLPGELTQEVVYGQDNRVEVYEAEEPYRDIARQAIGMLVEGSSVDESNPEDVGVRSQGPHGQVNRLCRTERFWNQPSSGQCSGTLIDDRLFVTAGHCVSSTRCTNMRVVFNFLYESDGTLATITQRDVYRCERLVALRQLSRSSTSFRDYAVMELDRPVEGRRPAEVRREGLGINDPVALLGFPSGIPLKVAVGGRVTAPGADDVFQATVDAFAGNSGSGVFDENGRIVGILSSGAGDFARNGGCNVVNVLPETCRPGQCGENIGYIGQAIEELCSSGYQSARLCGSSTPVDAGIPAADVVANETSIRSDGGVGDGGTAMRPAGCTCRTTPAHRSNDNARGALLLLVLALVWKRSSKPRAVSL